MAPHPALRFFLALALAFATFHAPQHHVEANGGSNHFVLVHGLGHGAWCWYKIITLLQASGNRATAIDLTSNGISKVVADSVTSFEEYAQPLTEVLATLNDKVIIVGHSLGGAIISYAMEKFPHKIEKAVFLAAAMPANNQSASPAETIEQLTSGGLIKENFANGLSSPATSVSIISSLAKDYTYNQSPPQDATLAITLLNPTPFVALTTVLNLTSANYGSIPRFYLRTTLDRAAPPEVQASIIQQNPPYGVFTINNSDHSPFFSKPVCLTNILLKVASIDI